MNIEDIIRNIQLEIASIECTYNITPNKIILGEDIVYKLTDGMTITDITYNYDTISFMGIPVNIDHEDTRCIKVCLEFDVKVN